MAHHIHLESVPYWTERDLGVLWRCGTVADPLILNSSRPTATFAPLTRTHYQSNTNPPSTYFNPLERAACMKHTKVD
eukprot:scaffold84403_cov36-Tisochrysis_lutea.AAC.1